MEHEPAETVDAALIDFQRYLLDQVPPLTVSDSVDTLIHQPPELLMREIHPWALEQSRVHAVALVDCFFYALKKIYAIGMLKLLDRAAVDRYVAALTPLAMQACPAEDREALRVNVEAMRKAQTLDGTAAIAKIPTPTAAPSPPERSAAGADGLVARSARRLSLVIDRLTRFLPGKPAPAATAEPPPVDTPPEQPAAQLVSMAAASANSEQELQAYMERLKVYTGETQPENLFRLLASNVPGWELNVPPDVKLKPSAPVEAMHKIISLTKNPSDRGRRFRELLMSAIEQFNAGSLPAAVSILELAEVVIAEKKLDPASVDRMRTDAVEAISPEQLKKYSELKSKHTLLRKALTFFPALTKESLLRQLRGEVRPERRRSLLGLLEAYGTAARDEALAELESELDRPAGEADTYYLRNVIYLLHRIAREPDAPVDRELALLARASARGQSIYVIKEAVLPLGQIRSDAAVKLLITRLAEFESMLMRSDPTYPAEEMQKLLDRIVGALARIGTPAALLTVARHGIKPNPVLGDTRARLAVLGQHDLSFDEETVRVLVKIVRDDLPTKLLGRLIPKRQPPPVKVIEALAGTHNEVVEELMAEVAEKFPDHEVGKAAAAALSNAAAAGRQPAPASHNATLTGDLQFFGLPSLMQSLADSNATGVATLHTKRGQTAGKLLFLDGKFVDAQAGHLRGVDALYALLERPVAGSFAFVPQKAPARAVQPREVMPLLFEGIRRHDELKQISVVIPDDLVLRPTGAKPTPDEEESEPAVMREVWVKASGGAPVRDWESQVAADPYRIRRLVAHWLEQGALQVASPGGSHAIPA